MSSNNKAFGSQRRGVGAAHMSPRDISMRERAKNNFYNCMAASNQMKENGSGSLSSSPTPSPAAAANIQNSGVGFGPASGDSSLRPLSIRDRFAMHADVAQQAAHQQMVTNSSLHRQPTLASMTRGESFGGKGVLGGGGVLGTQTISVQLASPTPLRAPPLPQPSVETKPTNAAQQSVSGSPSPFGGARGGGGGEGGMAGKGKGKPAPAPYRRPRPDDALLSMAVPNINSLAPGVYSSSAKKPPSRGLGGGAFPPSLPVRMERNPVTGTMRAVSRDTDSDEDDNDFEDDDNDLYGGVAGGHPHGDDDEEESNASFSLVENGSIALSTAFGGGGPPSNSSNMKGSRQPVAFPASVSHQHLARAVSFDVRSSNSNATSRSAAGPSSFPSSSQQQQQPFLSSSSTPNQFMSDADRQMHLYSLQLAASPNAAAHIGGGGGGGQGAAPGAAGLPIVLQKTFRLLAIAYTNPVVRLFRDKHRAPPLPLIEAAVRGNRQNLLQPHQFYQWCLRVLWLDNPNFYKGPEGEAALRALSGGVAAASASPNPRGSGASSLPAKRGRMGSERSTTGAITANNNNGPTSAPLRHASPSSVGALGGTNSPTTGSYFDKRRAAAALSPSSQRGGGGFGDADASTPAKFDLQQAHEELYRAGPSPAKNTNNGTANGNARRGAKGAGATAAGLNATPQRRARQSPSTTAPTTSSSGDNSRGGMGSAGGGRPQSSDGKRTPSPPDVSSSLSGGKADIDAVQRLATPSNYTRSRARAMHKEQRAAALGNAGRLNISADAGGSEGRGGGGLHSGFAPLSGLSVGGGGGSAGGFGSGAPLLGDNPPAAPLMTTGMKLRREKRLAEEAAAEAKAKAEVERAAAAAATKGPIHRRVTIGAAEGGGGNDDAATRRTSSMQRRQQLQRQRGSSVGTRGDEESLFAAEAEESSSSDDDAESVVSACSDDLDTTPSSVRHTLAMLTHTTGLAAARGGGAGGVSPHGRNASLLPSHGGSLNSPGGNPLLQQQQPSAAADVAGSHDSDLRAVFAAVSDPSERVALLKSLANFRRTHFLARQHLVASLASGGGDGGGGDRHHLASSLASLSFGSPRSGINISNGGVSNTHHSTTDASAQEGDGGVDVFANAMRSVGAGVPFSRAEVQQLFQLLDANDDGVLEHRELCDGMVHLLSVDGPLMPLLHRFQTLVEPRFRRDVRLVRISRQELVLFQEAAVAVLLRQLRAKVRRRERFINHYRLSGVLFPADEGAGRFNDGSVAVTSGGAVSAASVLAGAGGSPLPLGAMPSYNNEAAQRLAAAEAKKGNTVVKKADGSVIIVKEIPNGANVNANAKGAAGKSPETSSNTNTNNSNGKRKSGGGGRAHSLRSAVFRQGGADEYSDEADEGGGSSPTAAKRRHHLPLPARTAPFDALKAKKQLLVKYQAAKATGGARLSTRQKLSDFILPENEDYFHNLRSTQWFLRMEERYGGNMGLTSSPAAAVASAGGSAGDGVAPSPARLEEARREAEAKVDARRRREMLELGRLAALRRENARNEMQSRMARSAEVCPQTSLLGYLVALKRRDEGRVAAGAKRYRRGGSGGEDGDDTNRNDDGDDEDDDDDEELSDHDDYAIDLPLTSLRHLASASTVDAQIAARRLRAAKARPLPRYMAATSASAASGASTVGGGVAGGGGESQQHAPLSHEFLLEGMDKQRPVPDTAAVRAVLHYLDVELTLPIKLLEQTIRRFFIDYDAHILSLIGAEPVSYKVVQEVLGAGNDHEEEGDEAGDGTPTSSCGGGNGNGTRPLKSNKFAAQLASAIPTSAKEGPRRGAGGDDDDYGSDDGEGRCNTAGVLSVGGRRPSAMAFSIVSMQSSAPPTADQKTRGTSMEAAATLNRAAARGDDGGDGSSAGGKASAAPYIRSVAQRYFVGRLPRERPLRESFLSYYYRELDADEGETVFRPMRHHLQHPTLERVGREVEQRQQQQQMMAQQHQHHGHGHSGRRGGSEQSQHNINGASDATAVGANGLGGFSSAMRRSVSNASMASGGGAPPQRVPSNAAAASIPFAVSISPAGPHKSNPLVLHSDSRSGAGADSPGTASLNNTTANGGGGAKRTVGGLALSSINANATDANRRTLFNPDSPRTAAMAPPNTDGTRLPPIVGAAGGGGLGGMGALGDGGDAANPFAAVGMLSGAGGKMAASAFFARRKTTAPVMGRPAEEYTNFEHVVIDGRVVVRPKHLLTGGGGAASGSASGSAGSPLLPSTRNATPHQTLSSPLAALSPQQLQQQRGGGSSNNNAQARAQSSLGGGLTPSPSTNSNATNRPARQALTPEPTTVHKRF